MEEIDGIVKNFNQDISIIVKNIDSNDYIYHYNNNTKFKSASLIKVFILLYILDLVDKKKITLNLNILIQEKDILPDTEVFENGEQFCTVEELINWMIITSDNTATNVLLKYFGIDNVNNYIKEHLHTSSTLLQRYMLDGNSIKNGIDNYTSQEDMLLVFSKLIKKEILNNDLCELAINILANQRKQNQVMRYIYNPVCYIHKTGLLNGLNHDCGIMNINNTWYYIGISIWNYKNNKDHRPLAGKLGRLIYNYLKNLEK